MREKVARALLLRTQRVMGWDEQPLSELTADERDEYYADADTALDCLTTRPTERMISAGLQECAHAAFVMDADDVQRVYEAMTAAMIKEGHTDAPK